jgi:hypothetical protein
MSNRLEIAMDEITRNRIRHIFLSPRPSFPLMTAADLLGMTLEKLRRELETGAIVAVSTRLGEKVTREEMSGGVPRRHPGAVARSEVFRGSGRLEACGTTAWEAAPRLAGFQPALVL